MRLSRPRVLVRAALLAVGGAFMGWRAFEAWRSAREQGSLLLSRMALVFALMAVLALLTAAVALGSLRPRKRGPTLHLGAGRPPDGEGANPPAPDRLTGPGDPP